MQAKKKNIILFYLPENQADLTPQLQKNTALNHYKQTTYKITDTGSMAKP